MSVSHFCTFQTSETLTLTFHITYHCVSGTHRPLPTYTNFVQIRQTLWTDAQTTVQIIVHLKINKDLQMHTASLFIVYFGEILIRITLLFAD